MYSEVKLHLDRIVLGIGWGYKSFGISSKLDLSLFSQLGSIWTLKLSSLGLDWNNTGMGDLTKKPLGFEVS